MANMACSLIEHKRINTTLAKAKALKQFVEPLLTRSKAENNQTTEKGTHNRRIAFSNLRSKEAVTELFSTVAEKIGDRPGGYTRIIKLGNRLGDNAEMAMIELVDFNEIYNAGKATKKTTRRSRRSKGKSEEAAPAAPGKQAKAAPEETAEAVAQADAVAVEETVVEEAGAEETQAEAASEESEDEVKKDDAEA